MPSSYTPSQYSSARLSTPGATAAATLGQFDVNFSGHGGSYFTVGGWMRLLQTPVTQAQTIFVASATGPMFTFSVKTDGYLVAAFGSGTSPSVTGEVPITDTAWHYVAASYQESSNPGQGALSIYIDGFLAATAEVDSTAPVTDRPTVLVGANPAQQLDFASWSVWPVALSAQDMEVPEWSAPQTDDTRIVCAVDFANGPASDQSGSNWPVTVDKQLWHTPCLLLSAGGSATPESGDGLNPGGPAAFSVLVSVQAPNSSTSSFPILTNTSDFRIAVLNDGSGGQNLQVSRKLVTGSATVTTGLPFPGKWTHVAVTYDQSNLRVYVNGDLAQTLGIAASNMPPITAPNVTFGGGQPQGSWALQGLSVWSTALSSADIADYMGGTTPPARPVWSLTTRCRPISATLRPRPC